MRGSLLNLLGIPAHIAEAGLAGHPVYAAERMNAHG